MFICHILNTNVFYVMTFLVQLIVYYYVSGLLWFCFSHSSEIFRYHNILRQSLVLASRDVRSHAYACDERHYVNTDSHDPLLR